MPTSNSRLPNVIVIVMDTTRTKNLSCLLPSPDYPVS